MARTTDTRRVGLDHMADRLMEGGKDFHTVVAMLKDLKAGRAEGASVLALDTIRGQCRMVVTDAKEALALLDEITEGN